MERLETVGSDTCNHPDIDICLLLIFLNTVKMKETTEHETGSSSKGPLTAIGIFLGVFGIAVLSGIFFTHTLHGKIINLVCGGLLLTLGLVAIYNDQVKNKTEN
jgi:putative Ca2+/H+ antiporter (TMEM165/GDT1 family)